MPSDLNQSVKNNVKAITAPLSENQTMKTFNITTLVKEVRPDELDSADRELIEAAKQATARSYAPYSKFHVGAAIRMADGRIVTGSNQENAAYPSGTCAERTAAYWASSQYPGMAMKKIAVAAWTRQGHDSATPDAECFQAMPISPCGACRQALLEYETLYGPIEVLLYGADKTYVLPSIKSLLPFSFTEF